MATAGRPTIKDVASHAGVSTAAVSYVLNGKSAEVSPVTRERIRAAIEALDYRPSAVARGLVNRGMRAIGVTVAHLAEAGGLSYFAETLQGLARVTFELGYSLTLHTDDGAPSSRVLREFRDRGAEGVIAIGWRAEEISTVVGAGEPVLPTVAVGLAPSSLLAGVAGIDNVRGAALATGHLVRLGHARVALVMSGAGQGDQSDRRSGYRQALEEADLPAEARLEAVTDGTEAGGYQAADHLLSLSSPPDAIFATNDLLALGVCKAASRRGVSVPEQLAVVGYGDYPGSAYAVPALTTVRQPLTEVGEAAGEAIVAAVTGKSSAGKVPAIFTPKLVIRESCGSHLWL